LHSKRTLTAVVEVILRIAGDPEVRMKFRSEVSFFFFFSDRTAQSV
jgi:hypothetical protein